jgi:DNA invertase Pin-like site-specific DNA recombinase
MRASRPQTEAVIQLDALNTAGCDRIFDDHASGQKPIGLA